MGICFASRRLSSSAAAGNAINVQAAVNAASLSLTASAADITVASGLTASSGDATLRAYENLVINGAISATGTLTGTAGGAVSVNANVGANSVSLKANGGNLTLTFGVITGTTGITLATTGNFINNAGSDVLSVSSGKWLIYSTDPSKDTVGGLTPDFYQYAASIGTAVATTGNGLLYSLAPTLSVVLSGTLEKSYDGTTAATITAANATVSGLVNSDTVTLTASYASANAGSGITVTVAPASRMAAKLYTAMPEPRRW